MCPSLSLALGGYALSPNFHRYKRAFGAIRSTIPDGQAIFDQSHALQMFLASPVHPKQLIFFNLRSELKKIDGHEEVLAEMLAQCTDFLERGIFVTPDDKCVAIYVPNMIDHIVLWTVLFTTFIRALFRKRNLSHIWMS